MFGQIFRRFKKWMENLNIFGWIVWSGSWTCQKSFPSLHQILFKYGWSRFYFETIEVFTFKNLAFFYCNFCIFIAKIQINLIDFFYLGKKDNLWKLWMNWKQIRNVDPWNFNLFWYFQCKGSLDYHCWLVLF